MKPAAHPTRLPWQSFPEGGFIAYPDGEEHRDRFATLSTLISSGGWTWTVRSADAVITGYAASKQAAADAATEAWPKVVETACQLAATAARDAQRLAMIDAIADDPDPDLSSFGVEEANYENLMWIMDRIRSRARTPGILKLMQALSAQFYKLRR